MFQQTLILVFFVMSLCGCAGEGSSSVLFGNVDNQPDEVQPVGLAIPARQYVTNTVRISGGHYPVPYIISTPNTEYILDGDITADGTAIAIRASKVVLNLNGRTITYNRTMPGEGVVVDVYGKADIAVVNGSIMQGGAMSEGDQYGTGNNPVRAKPHLVARLQIAKIYVRYGGRDVGGFKLSGEHALIENNTVEDAYEFGTLKNRHQGIYAIEAGIFAVVRNNTIINSRHMGVGVNHSSEVYGNSINVRSICTNSYGIFGWGVKDVKVYDNTIMGRGEHPVGISFSGPGTNNIEIYNNTIDVQTTRLGEEYGGSSTCWNPATPCGNYAVGYRGTKNGHNVNFHGNTIVVHTDSAYRGTYSPTGEPVVVNGKGRGLMVGIPDDGANGDALFADNTITVLDRDGTGLAFGIACTGELNRSVSEMVFRGNTVTSNIMNVVLGDEYGACTGYPLFTRNTFVKADNYPSYRTIGTGLGGYFEGTGRFMSNYYRDGASESSLGMHFQNTTNGASYKNKSIIFGRLMEGFVRDGSGRLLADARVRTFGESGVLQTEATSGVDGVANVMVYDYELHNNGGTTGSEVPETVVFMPHTLELYNLTTNQELFTIPPDNSAAAWDSPTGKGVYTFSHVNGSVSIKTAETIQQER